MPPIRPCRWRLVQTYSAPTGFDRRAGQDSPAQGQVREATCNALMRFQQRFVNQPGHPRQNLARSPPSATAAVVVVDKTVIPVALGTAQTGSLRYEYEPIYLGRAPSPGAWICQRSP
jgi:hypothetical protein